MIDLLIDGKRVKSSSGKTREIIHPANGKVVEECQEATIEDVEKAIKSARKSFDSGIWAKKSVAERSQILVKVADLLERDKSSFAKAESKDTAKRYIESEYDMDDVIRVFRYFANLILEQKDREVKVDRENIKSKIKYEPVGVVGLITPWNYPLLQASWKIAPALAAGCSFVIKPSELTPSTTSLLMDTLSEAGVPAGVHNLVLGAGNIAGAPLSSHPDIDLVSFTGGLITGKKVMEQASKTVKKVALELGGKNPNIVFADADMDAAIDNALTAVFLHSGQVCSAGARLIVEEKIHDQFVAEVARRADLIRLGSPDDALAETGALISENHRLKVEKYVQDALNEGAVLRAGGKRPTESHLQDGFFFRPTVLDNCNTKMNCVQDESFGPVLTVETFKTEEEAIHLGNDTIYGLAGAVWTNDLDKANRVADSLRHGTIWINDYHPYVPQAEWGGFKQSGVGRELGPMGLAEYQEAKHIWQNQKPSVTGWFDGKEK
ncbi:MAG: aldehyde dehydrogenase family protein [Actinobacteria bacterium]|nr:aldehyde dehydrogenase family protein [Actinomycetota bacterium]